MAFRYNEWQHAQQQLDQCVVMTENGPVFLEYENRWDYKVVDLATGEEELIDIQEAGITFAPLSLGYVNFRYDLLYVSRIPKRMWKAGLTVENMRTMGNWNPDYNLLTSSGLGECLMNTYPSLEVAWKNGLQGGSVAFHKDFAFDKNALCYKGMNIGDTDEDGNLRIQEDFLYVKEQLEEIIHAEG